MSYTKSLLQYRSIADKITSGEYQPKSKEMAQEAKRSLVAKPERRQEAPVQQASASDAMSQTFMDYMTAMKKRSDEGQDPGDGIDTQTVESAPRPRSRREGGYDDPVRDVMNTSFQEQLGLDESTAGVLSRAFMLNFQDESGMVPDRVETVPNVHGTRGKGYYQLTGDRRESFEKKYGADGYTAENQVQFLISELGGAESRAGKAILAAAQTGNVGETAAVIVDKFLRPAEKHKQERMSRYRSTTG